MKKFFITTDSTADLPIEYLEKNNIKYLALNYMIDNKEYSYKDDLSLSEYYEKMRNGSKTSTMQATIKDTEELFTSLLSEGYDVLHIAFSSALSGSYNTECVVAENIKEKYPNSRIEIVDSLSASMAQGLLVQQAVKMRDDGLELDEIVRELKLIVPRLVHYFTVEDMIYLYRGGRVSKGKTVIAKAINIKPILNCSEDGKLNVVSKARGRKKSLKAICDMIKDNLSDGKYKNSEIIICDADCNDDAKYLEEIIKEELGIDNIVHYNIGPTIGAHCGPGTVGVFFIGKHR